MGIGNHPSGGRHLRVVHDPSQPTKATALRIIARENAIKSLRHHTERLAEAERLLYLSICSARRGGLTFQEIADIIGVAKGWAWKLHQKGLALEAERGYREE